MALGIITITCVERGGCMRLYTLLYKIIVFIKNKKASWGAQSSVSSSQIQSTWTAPADGVLQLVGVAISAGGDMVFYIAKNNKVEAVLSRPADGGKTSTTLIVRRGDKITTDYVAKVQSYYGYFYPLS